MDRSISHRGAFTSSCIRGLALVFGLALIAASTAAVALEPCGTGMYPFPYTDVASVTDPFCPGIMEAYVTGISKGTTPTTFSPNNTVTRLQMTTFLQRSLDQGLTRANRRTVLRQLWQTNTVPQTITSTGFPVFCASDGENIWVASYGTVDKVEASTGTILGTWTGATQSWPIFPIPGLVLVADNITSTLWFIDPTVPPGTVGIGLPLPSGSSSIAYDGTRIWIANYSGSVSIVTLIPFSLVNVSTGFTQPVGVLYDGAHIWVTDYGAGKLFQLNTTGTIAKTVTVGAGPEQPAFDGENIWVPNSTDSSITVVQASTGNVVATIAPDGVNLLSAPEQAAFDGERIAVTNKSGNSVTIFKAADLSVIANISTGAASPYGVCSDGINFWVSFASTHFLQRY